MVGYYAETCMNADFEDDANLPMIVRITSCASAFAPSPAIFEWQQTSNENPPRKENNKEYSSNEKPLSKGGNSKEYFSQRKRCRSSFETSPSRGRGAFVKHRQDEMESKPAKRHGRMATRVTEKK